LISFHLLLILHLNKIEQQIEHQYVNLFLIESRLRNSIVFVGDSSVSTWKLCVFCIINESILILSIRSRRVPSGPLPRSFSTANDPRGSLPCYHAHRANRRVAASVPPRYSFHRIENYASGDLTSSMRGIPAKTKLLHPLMSWTWTLFSTKNNYNYIILST
jgi:hypothetical protein